jgi:hypothetical protein
MIKKFTCKTNFEIFLLFVLAPDYRKIAEAKKDFKSKEQKIEYILNSQNMIFFMHQQIQEI